MDISRPWAWRSETTHAANSVTALIQFAELRGELLLDNDHVVVQKFVLAPGGSTGVQSHPADQLLVFIRGGVLTSSGRSVLWKEGRVQWRAAGNLSDAPAVNSGSTAIEMVCVSLKRPRGAPPNPAFGYLNYPNIPGEDLIENDRVIVQRFKVDPGQWEGIHGHHPNTMYIHIKGGQWAARSKSEPERASPNFSETGSVGWMTPFDISEGHESGNVGKEPIDLVWVQLR